MPRERNFRRSGSLAAAVRVVASHLANPALLAAYAVGFGVLFSFVSTFTYVNFVLAAPPFSLSTQALGAIFVVYLVGVAVTPLTGRLVMRLGRRGVVVAASVVWLAGLAVTLAPSLAAILAGLAICVSCGFLCQSCATSFVAITARHGRSSAVGLYVTFYYLGGGAGVVVSGYGWRYAGWPGCVAIVAVMVVVVAALAWLFWRAPDQTSPER